MTLIRLKVQTTEEKSSNSYRKTSVQPLRFIYILDLASNPTVNDLRNLLEKHIVQQYSTNIQIVQITTSDGYHLSDDYLCQQIFKDNDSIVCCDMAYFVEENYSSLDLSNLWCEMKQHDASDNQEKYIQVGLTNKGKLFVRMYGSSKFYGLYIFTTSQLFNLAKQQSTKETISKFGLDTLIARLGNQDWFLEAKWEYVRDSTKELFLICRLKLGDSEQITLNKIQILFNESERSLEKGEVSSSISGINDENNRNEARRERLKQLAASIPSATYTGLKIDIDKDTNKSITKHECQGDSLVQMTCGDTYKIVICQDTFGKDNGTFEQDVIIEHINFIPKLNEEDSSKKNLSIVNINVLYEDTNGTWCECTDVAIASIAWRNQQPVWLANTIVNFEDNQIVSYTIKGTILVNGKPGRDNFRRRRSHKSLPQPLKLKIVLQDNFNQQSSLIVEQLNEPLDIETSTSFAKYNQSSIKELLAFVYADDCEMDERIFLALYLNNDGELVINSDRSYSITLNQRNIRTMEFNAKKERTVEVPFDSIYYQYEAREKKATALFDKETFMFYAVRFEVTTKTSKTQETVVVPIENIK